MKRYLYSLGAMMLLGGALPAMAQSYYYGGPRADLPLHWYVDAGYSATTGQTSNYLDGGWNIGGGLQWRPAPGPFSLRADLSFSRFDATNQLLNQGAQQFQTYVDNGWSDVVTYDIDGVFDIPLGGGVTAYVMAGGGGAYRRIELTQRAGGRGYYCNGFTGFCGEGYPGNYLVDRETANKAEWNAGVGVNFPLWGLQSWFIEAKYTQMQTPVATSFVPIRVGYRF